MRKLRNVSQVDSQVIQEKLAACFGRVDRFEILRPDICGCCGHTNFASVPIKTETQQVAQLVERPIEVVEYHRHTCLCEHCGNPQLAKIGLWIWFQVRIWE